MVVRARDYPFGRNLEKENFWIRTITATNCGQYSEGDDPDERQGVVRYSLRDTAAPTSIRTGGINETCRDEPMASLIPIVPWTVGKPANPYQENDTYEVGIVPPSGEQPRLYGEFARWAIGEKPLWLNFSDPTLLHVHDQSFDPKAVVIPEVNIPAIPLNVAKRSKRTPWTTHRKPGSTC